MKELGLPRLRAPLPRHCPEFNSGDRQVSNFGKLLRLKKNPSFRLGQELGALVEGMCDVEKRVVTSQMIATVALSTHLRQISVLSKQSFPLMLMTITRLPNLTSSFDVDCDCVDLHQP